MSENNKRAVKLTKYVEFDGRRYRRFIPYPGPVRDGTVRCIQCGQIDEDGVHDMAVCVAALTGRRALEDRA